jgi:hypothetical protein
MVVDTRARQVIHDGKDICTDYCSIIWDAEKFFVMGNFPATDNGPYVPSRLIRAQDVFLAIQRSVVGELPMITDTQQKITTSPPESVDGLLNEEIHRS